MATKKASEAQVAEGPMESVLDVPVDNTATDNQRTSVLKEMRETGRVRSGYVVNFAWPDLVRKVEK